VGRLRQVIWDEADLEARLCRALDVTKKTLAYFAVDGFEDAEVPENNFRPEKPVAECAMLIYAASLAMHLPNVANRIDEIAHLLVPYARSQQTLLNIALHPSLCIDYAVPHILLSKLGYYDLAFDSVLKSSMSSQSCHGHERPPFAALEQRWITSLWMDASPGRDWRPDLLNSVLYHPLDILGGLRQDFYAFTHLIMYCTDFGFRPSLFPRPRSLILDDAQSLLAKCLDEEDYDLAAEVLLSWPLSGARWSATASFGFRVLARVEDQVGVLPAGITKAARLNKLRGEERTRYALGTGYHTALVMGLICSVSLRPGRAPSVRVTGPQVEKSFLDFLLNYLEQDQGHWQPIFSELTNSERRALVSLLLDIVIIQKCRKHDYKAVIDVLSTSSRYGLANSPICAQAAQLLERLSACSYAVSSNKKMDNCQCPVPGLLNTKTG